MNSQHPVKQSERNTDKLSDKKFNKALKSYLANDLGITKDFVVNEIRNYIAVNETVIQDIVKQQIAECCGVSSSLIENNRGIQTAVQTATISYIENEGKRLFDRCMSELFAHISKTLTNNDKETN